MHSDKLARRLGLLALTAALGIVPVGCTSYERWINPPPPVDPTAIEQYASLPPEVAHDLAAGEQAFRQEDYHTASSLLHRVAEDKTVTPVAAEKARYYQAESLRLRGNLTEAMRTYNRLLQDFPSGSYRTDSCARMYEIANLWLEDLRDEIRQEQEKLRGERSFVIPAMAMVSFSKEKPFLSAEGYALEYLEAMHYADPTGPYADKSLWLLGYVNFYRGDYVEAELYLDQLVHHYPDSKLRPAALELAIMAKNNSTGGPDYDGRKSAEAIKLIHAARASMPEMAQKRGDFLDRQLVLISHQQAMKEYNIAEFYRRTGHPGSAYFFYEIVRRRYPGDPYSKLAGERMEEIRSELENDKGRIRKRLAEPAASGNLDDWWQWLWGNDDSNDPIEGLEGPIPSTTHVAPVPQEYQTR